jgi:hypothetical protein
MYRAPRTLSHSWKRDGSPVVGATSSQLEAQATGKYTCAVTAANAAGSTTQTSAAHAVSEAVTPRDNNFKLGKAKLNKKRGTAKLPITVPGAGKLQLSGKGVKKANKTADKKGTYKLKVRPSKKTAKKLKKAGKAKVKVKVSYTPTGGQSKTKSKKIKLVRKS